MKTLILNSSNITNTDNSRFTYNFPLGGYTFKDDVIAVNSISQYFSTFNVSASAYNNNSFSYTWVNDNTEYPVVIPDGFYSVPELNAFLQSVMFSNKHYLTTSAGQYVYFLELVINQSKYAVSVNSFLMSTAIATANGWSLPAGATWYIPITNIIVPCLIVPSTNNFGKLIGFTGGKYPNASISGSPIIQTPTYTVSQSILSSIAPQITPYSSILVFCSLVNNRSTIPSQLIYSYTPIDATFGALQEYQPQAELAWNEVQDGTYTQFTVELKDQLGNNIRFQDGNTLITLITKNKSEKY